MMYPKMLSGANKYRNRRAADHQLSPLDHGLAFTIRFAYPDDAVALRRLAAIDSQRPLDGRLLVAEVNGEIWAAISVDGDGRAIADPFRHTAALVSILEHHARNVPATRTHIPVRGARAAWHVAAG